MKAAESANRLNSQLKVGDFCKIPNVWSEVIFLGVFFGATTNIIEKKGYNLTRDERYTFKTTNTKKMYVFVSPELTKIEFRSNLNQVELINSGLPIYVDKANEILDLFDKDKELLLKTLLKQGVKDTYYKSRRGFDIRRKALLKPISFISMTKSKDDFKISSNLKMVELIKGINSLSAGRKIWDEKPENITIADFSSDSKYDGPERKVLPLILELLNK